MRKRLTKMTALALCLMMGLSGCSAPSAPSDTKAPAATGTAAEGGDAKAEGSADGNTHCFPGTENRDHGHDGTVGHPDSL